MTRINLVPPSILTDQHLMAEKAETNQLAGQFIRSTRSNNFKFHELPSRFTLNKGHVSFFYRRGAFLRRRSVDIYEECVRRGFGVTNNFNDVWAEMPAVYNLDFEPGMDDYSVSSERIILRIMGKPGFYRYMGEKIDPEQFVRLYDEWL